MVSISAVSLVAIPVSYARTQNRNGSSESFFKPLRPLKGSKSSSKGKFLVNASLKEKAATGLTAAALTASMMVPEVAEAATASGVTPSLNNFLFSIAAGGVVLAAILGAVIGVSNFDPVKRT